MLLWLLHDFSQNFILEAQNNDTSRLVHHLSFVCFWHGSGQCSLDSRCLHTFVGTWRLLASSSSSDEFFDIPLGNHGARLMICCYCPTVGINCCEFNQNSHRHFNVWSKININQTSTNNKNKKKCSQIIFCKKHNEFSPNLTYVYWRESSSIHYQRISYKKIEELQEISLKV